MNQFIEEDWERLMQLDSIYVLEHKIEIENEYWRWEEEQKPSAIVTLNINEYDIRLFNRKKVQKKYKGKL